MSVTGAGRENRPLCSEKEGWTDTQRQVHRSSLQLKPRMCSWRQGWGRGAVPGEREGAKKEARR